MTLLKLLKQSAILVAIIKAFAYHLKLSHLSTVIKVERTSDEDVNKGYTFPDEDDDLTNYEGEHTQLMIPSSLLQDINSK